jgi:hypothetical protein
VIGGRVASISYGFGGKLEQKRTTKAKSQNLNFLILHPVLMQFFAKWSSLMGY